MPLTFECPFLVPDHEEVEYGTDGRTILVSKLTAVKNAAGRLAEEVIFIPDGDVYRSDIKEIIDEVYPSI